MKFEKDYSFAKALREWLSMLPLQGEQVQASQICCSVDFNISTL